MIFIPEVFWDNPAIEASTVGKAMRGVQAHASEPCPMQGGEGGPQT